jgi:hypothetical protein
VYPTGRGRSDAGTRDVEGAWLHRFRDKKIALMQRL